MKYFRVTNLEKHQHYKKRSPPWIKLHATALDDYEFLCLQDASKAHLMLIWLLASKLQNRIPYDPQFVANKIGATEPVDLEALDSHGFIEAFEADSKALAPRKQTALPETEGDAEAEGESKGATTDNSARVPVEENRSKTESPPEADLAELMPNEFHADVGQFLKPMPPARRQAWASNLVAKLNGMHPPKIEPRIAGLALRQMLANGETNWKRFEGYCRLEAEGPPAVPENSGKRGTGRSAIEAEIKLAAAKQLEEIKKLRIGVQTVQGIKYHIPAQSLEELPPAVRSAIAALGGSLAAGAQRIIECPTDKYSILLGQFQTLYAGAVNTERARMGAHA
jgi:hypothetical protein